jgi:hypothetical protein
LFDGSDAIVFVDNHPGLEYGRLSAVSRADPGGPRRRSDIRCHRAYAAADRIVCLRETNAFVGDHEALIMDRGLRILASYPLPGMPSRARLSADGTIAAWTVFVTGDSYTTGTFSTRTSILDLRTGRLESNLEKFSIVLGGKPYRASDVNIWGVTVAADDRTFYATLATGSRTYLVKGDLVARSLTTLRQNVECPSLSPDGTRIAFKKRVSDDTSGRPWRLHVLDLATMTETPLAETRNDDDQALWLDNDTVAYGLLTGQPDQIGVQDLWTVPASGGGTPARLLDFGSSPALAPALAPTPTPTPTPTPAT